MESVSDMKRLELEVYCGTEGWATREVVLEEVFCRVMDRLGGREVENARERPQVSALYLRRSRWVA